LKLITIWHGAPGASAEVHWFDERKNSALDIAGVEIVTATELVFVIVVSEHCCVALTSVSGQVT
jgi:hypothetical protein